MQHEGFCHALSSFSYFVARLLSISLWAQLFLYKLGALITPHFFHFNFFRPCDLFHIYPLLTLSVGSCLICMSFVHAYVRAKRGVLHEMCDKEIDMLDGRHKRNRTLRRAMFFVMWNYIFSV